MASVVTGADDILNCPICLEQYKIPRALPCLHTFCETCLIDWIKHKSVHNTLTIGSHRCFPCPVCKDDVCVPPEGIKGFRHNFYVANAIEPCSPKRAVLKENDLNMSMACHRCDEMGVSQICLKCNIWLCPLCCDDHKRVKGTKAHVLASNVDLSEASVSDSICEDNLSKCSLTGHGKLTCNYCTVCKTLVCEDCQRDNHKSHGVVSVLCKLNEITEKLQECLGNLQKRSEALEKQHTTLKAAKKDLVSQGHRTLKEFDGSYAAVQKKIQELRGNLLKNLKKQITDQVKKIDERITGINNKLAIEHSIEDEIKNVLQTMNKRDILTQSDFLLDQGEQCLNSHLIDLDHVVTISSPSWKACEEDLFDQLVTKLLGSCEYSGVEININKRIKKKARRTFVETKERKEVDDTVTLGLLETKSERTPRLVDIIRDFDPFGPSAGPSHSEESESTDGQVAENEEEAGENTEEYFEAGEVDSESPPSDVESDPALLPVSTTPPPPGPFYEENTHDHCPHFWWQPPLPHHHLGGPPPPPPMRYPRGTGRHPPPHPRHPHFPRGHRPFSPPSLFMLHDSPSHRGHQKPRHKRDKRHNSTH